MATTSSEKDSNKGEYSGLVWFQTTWVIDWRTRQDNDRTNKGSTNSATSRLIGSSHAVSTANDFFLTCRAVHGLLLVPCRAACGVSLSSCMANVPNSSRPTSWALAPVLTGLTYPRIRQKFWSRFTFGYLLSRPRNSSKTSSSFARSNAS